MKKTHGLEVSWEHFFSRIETCILLRLLGLDLDLKYFYVGILLWLYIFLD